MTDTPATKQSGENSFLVACKFRWKETFHEEEGEEEDKLCSGFVNSRILYTRLFRQGEISSINLKPESMG